MNGERHPARKGGVLLATLGRLWRAVRSGPQRVLLSPTPYPPTVLPVKGSPP